MRPRRIQTKQKPLTRKSCRSRNATSSLRDSPVLQTQIAKLEATDRVDLKLATAHAIKEGIEIITEAYRAGLLQSCCAAH